MAAVTRDIPLIARASARGRAETRAALGLTGDRPVVLPSFGGYGLELPWDELSRSRRFTLLRLDAAALERHGLRYPDVVAAADVVVSKPGYGIVSECIANGTALLHASRGRFAEQDVFLAGMPRLLRCRAIETMDLIEGRWADAVEALLAQPNPPGPPPRIDGAGEAASAIIDFLGW